MVRSCVALILTIAVAAISATPGSACTNLLVSSGASADGSTMITYAADSHDFYGELYFKAGGVHRQGAMREIYEWDTGTFLGRIPEAPVTYTRIGNINEHQVAIGETTFTGREELGEPNGIVDYGSLMYIVLERAKTAREAIRIIDQLLTEYGYASTGESFSISDSKEVWIMDLIGKGKDEKGAVWVARRVPDGYISGHANQSRINQFPLDQPDTTLYARDVISFARAKGWYEGPDSGFSFADAYAPIDFGALRFCEARVWSAFRRAAPSLDMPPDNVMGDATAEPLPLWIKPDRKLTAADVMALMRDHFEGTPMDMTRDVGAGPYACPYRWRPMTWEVDGEKYLHERAISTQQTAFSFVTQSRAWLPDPIGGLLWFGFDDTFQTVYTPIYCGIREVPPTYAEGVASLNTFSWDSGFWVFNWVSNQVYARWSDMIVELQTVQNELEGSFLSRQSDIEAAAKSLWEISPELARDHLTKYSVAAGEQVTKRWRKLGEHLLVKYLDGNVKDESGAAQHPPYPDEWYRKIVGERGDELKRREVEPSP